MRRILVSGGTGLVGHYLLQRLEAMSDCQVTAVSRQAETAPRRPSSVSWRSLDIEAHGAANVLDCDVLLHCGPLWLLPGWLEGGRADGPLRVIAFGSTSKFTKARSAHDGERDVAESLTRAEDALEELALRRGFRLTIFRPTLIYGGGLDKNVSVIARFIDRFGFFPLLGEAAGLRMPVHAADLAGACLSALDNANTFGRSYNLSGGCAIPYREMVTRIFAGLGRQPRMFSLSPGLLRGGIRAMRMLPPFRHLTPEMVNRMATDMVFDHGPAAADFGYSPREFRPGRQDLVPNAQSSN